MATVLAVLFFFFVFETAFSKFHETNLLNLFHDEIKKLQGNESRCVQDLKKYLKGLDQSEEWAMEMYDSSSKIPVGFLIGNERQLGSFDECLAINNDEIRGQHCMAKMDVLKTLFRNSLKGVRINREVEDVEKYLESRQNWWSICTPDSCRADDLQHIFDKILTDDFNLTFFKNRCQVLSSKPLDAAAWGTLVVFIAVLITVVLSTVYDLWLHSNQKKSFHPILLAFSALTNGKKMISINNNPDQLPCINGIKAISMFWIILFHIWVGLQDLPVMNMKTLVQWQYELWYSIAILGGSLAVDTFLAISGLLLVYGFLKSAEKGVPFNLPLFYIHRYLRLTPALLVLVLISVSLVPYIGSGPFWPEIYDMIEKPCQTKWWSTLIYVQNYVNDNSKVCVPHSWYLGLDMQLFVLSPILLISLKKFPKLGIAMITALLVLSIAIPMFFTWRNELKGFFIMDVSSYIKHYYFPTHCRYGTWLIGCATGYILFKMRNKKITFNKTLVGVSWLICFVIMVSSLFGGFNTLQHKYNRLETTLYVVLTRFAWSVGLGWIIFACVHGYGWIINDILCLPVFQILSKLCYTTYLTHYYVQKFMVFAIRTPFIYNDIDMLHRFWGDLIFSLLFAVILSLGFELPMITIEKVIFNKKEKKKPSDIPNRLKLEGGKINPAFVP